MLHILYITLYESKHNFADFLNFIPQVVYLRYVFLYNIVNVRFWDPKPMQL